MKTAILFPATSLDWQLADVDEEPIRRLPMPAWCHCGRGLDAAGSCPDVGCSGHTLDTCGVCGERRTAGTLVERTEGLAECCECIDTCACCGERVGGPALSLSPVTEQWVCGRCRTDEERDARDRGVTVADLAAEWARL
jgi:hypothetical protein